jgi:hypothetical protein
MSFVKPTKNTMRRSFLFLLAGLMCYGSISAQSTALDFTTTDCSGNPHHLFAELDAGKVVVISFVMLGCSPCIVGTQNLKGLVAGYEATHPGRVKLYSFGYLDSYTCSQMQSWKAANNFQHPMFSGGETQVTYYGGMGMPTIVVLAKGTHDVLFRKLGFLISDKPAITAAIEEGLTWSPSGIGDDLASHGIHLFPTLMSEQLLIQSDNLLTGEISLMGIQGNLVKSITVVNETRIEIPVSDLSKGIYTVIIRDEKRILGSARVIKE